MKYAETFRFTDLGAYTSDNFVLQLAEHRATLTIDRNFDYKSIQDDNNLVSQVLMFRFADNYIMNLPESTLIMNINTALDILLCMDNRYHDDKMFWKPMLSGIRAMKYLGLYHIIVNTPVLLESVDKDLFEQFRQRIMMHGQKLSERRFPLNNHGLQGLHALVALSTFGFTDISPNQATEKLVDSFSKLFDSDGFYRENSCEYHFFAIKLIEQFSSSGWYKDSGLENLHAKAVKASNILFADKDVIFLFGDTAMSDAAVQQLYMRYHNEGYDERLTVLKETGIVRSRFVRKDIKSTLLMINCYHNKTHNHHDYLSFEWFCDNRWLIIDVGKYAYQLDRKTMWTRSDHAHNTCGISELDHKHLKSEKTVNGTAGNGLRNIIGGEVNDRTFSFSRKLFHEFDKVVIRDRVKFHKRRFRKDVTSFLNIAPQFEFIENSGSKSIIFRDKDGRKLCIKHNTDAKCYYGSEEPLAGWYAPKYMVLSPCWQIHFALSETNGYSAKIEIEYSGI